MKMEMNMSKRTITAFAPFGLDPDGLPVDITFNYTKGRPAVMYLRNGDPGYPADPAEVEFVSVTCEDLTLPPAYQKKLDEWAVEYLASDDGYGKALDFADYKAGYAL